MAGNGGKLNNLESQRQAWINVGQKIQELERKLYLEKGEQKMGMAQAELDEGTLEMSLSG